MVIGSVINSVIGSTIKSVIGGDGLPSLPAGFEYLTDDDGNYLIDDDGNYLFGEV